MGSASLVDAGDPTAIAPGVATVIRPGGDAPLTVTVSELTARTYARELTAPDVGIVVRQGTRTLASTLAGADATAFPGQGTVTVAGNRYREVTLPFPGFGGPKVNVNLKSSRDRSATDTSGHRLGKARRSPRRSSSRASCCSRCRSRSLPRARSRAG